MTLELASGIEVAVTTLASVTPCLESGAAYAVIKANRTTVAAD